MAENEKTNETMNEMKENKNGKNLWIKKNFLSDSPSQMKLLQGVQDRSTRMKHPSETNSFGHFQDKNKSSLCSCFFSAVLFRFVLFISNKIYPIETKLQVCSRTRKRWKTKGKRKNMKRNVNHIVQMQKSWTLQIYKKNNNTPNSPLPISFIINPIIMWYYVCHYYYSSFVCIVHSRSHSLIENVDENVKEYDEDSHWNRWEHKRTQQKRRR